MNTRAFQLCFSGPASLLVRRGCTRVFGSWWGYGYVYAMS